MRQVVLDTETTGFDFKDGDRLVEIGAIELINRKATGETFHIYLNPEREIPEEAIKIHGITNEFIKDKPIFDEKIAATFIDFIKDSEVIIHNSAFDLSFLNGELEKLNKKHQLDFKYIEAYCQVTDSLKLANEKFLGSRNNLDALCKRFGIDNSARDLHGAVLDAQLLAEVYLELTGGQASFDFETFSSQGAQTKFKVEAAFLSNLELRVQQLTSQEREEHLNYLQNMQKTTGKSPVWSN